MRSAGSKVLTFNVRWLIMRSRENKGLWDQGKTRDYEIKGKQGIMRSRGTKGLWDQGELRDYEISGI